MTDELESLRQEIFRVHGVSVSKDDPIMVAHTLNARLLADSGKAQELILEQFKSELEGIVFQWGTDAKGKAERILNASLEASKEAMAALMQSSVKEAAKSMRAEADAAAKRADSALQSARNLTILSMGIGLISILASCLVAWSALN